MAKIKYYEFKHAMIAATSKEQAKKKYKKLKRLTLFKKVSEKCGTP